MKACVLSLFLDSYWITFLISKPFWMMLTLPIAQLALAFGADDLDGTVEEEQIIHAAGAKTGQKMTTTQLTKNHHRNRLYTCST